MHRHLAWTHRATIHLLEVFIFIYDSLALNWVQPCWKVTQRRQMETFSDALDLCAATSGDENAERAEKTRGCSSQRSNSYLSDAPLDCTSCLHQLRFIRPSIFNKPASFPALRGQGAAVAQPRCSVGWRRGFTSKSPQFISGTNSHSHSHSHL